MFINKIQEAHSNIERQSHTGFTGPFQEFINNKLKILIATHVSSRGLDMENVTHVINYDAPTSYDDYVHR